MSHPACSASGRAGSQLSGGSLSAGCHSPAATAGLNLLGLGLPGFDQHKAGLAQQPVVTVLWWLILAESLAFTAQAEHSVKGFARKALVLCLQSMWTNQFFVCLTFSRSPVHQYLSIVLISLPFRFLIKNMLENRITRPHFANVFLITHLSKSKPKEIIIINHPIGCSAQCQHGCVCWPGDCN